MTLVPIPAATVKISRDCWKRMKKAGDHHPWWFIGPNSLPSQAILARSTGNGVVKPGLTVYLIGGHDREVFVGENCDKFKIHEYVGLVDGTGWQPLVQLGRDVEMIDN